MHAPVRHPAREIEGVVKEQVALLFDDPLMLASRMSLDFSPSLRIPIEAGQGFRREAGHPAGTIEDTRAGRHYAEWTPERFRRWGADIGPHTEGLIIAILSRRPNPLPPGRDHEGSDKQLLKPSDDLEDNHWLPG